MLSNLFRNMPEVIKNLLIINVIMYFAMMAIPWVSENFVLYNIGSYNFKPYQLLTHFFMHSKVDVMHIVFNMFTLVMFGSHVERQIGSKKFLILYFVAAIGSMGLQLGINYIEYYNVISNYTDFQISEINEMVLSFDIDKKYPLIYHEGIGAIMSNNYSTMRGASGAIMGILAAFVYYNPNLEMGLFLIPIRVQAKYYIPFMMYVDLLLGVANFQWDNIAHWAHIGGAIAGFILVFIWKKDRNNFY